MFFYFDAEVLDLLERRRVVDFLAPAVPLLLLLAAVAEVWVGGFSAAGAASRVFSPSEELPRRRLRAAVRDAVEGSATCNRRPGSTLIPEILFQRRN